MHNPQPLGTAATLPPGMQTHQLGAATQPPGMQTPLHHGQMQAAASSTAPISGQSSIPPALQQPGMSDICTCGEVFMPDRAFCRKCGNPRQLLHPTLAGPCLSMASSLPTMQVPPLPAGLAGLDAPAFRLPWEGPSRGAPPSAGAYPGAGFSQQMQP